jgi:hypothetical protein
MRDTYEKSRLSRRLFDVVGFEVDTPDANQSGRKGHDDQHVYFCFSHPQYNGKHVVEKVLDTCNLVPSAKFPDNA